MLKTLNFHLLSALLLIQESKYYYNKIRYLDDSSAGKEFIFTVPNIRLNILILPLHNFAHYQMQGLLQKAISNHLINGTSINSPYTILFLTCDAESTPPNVLLCMYLPPKSRISVIRK